MKMSFKHDCSTSDDIRMVKYLYKVGGSGYGVYWALIETLHKSPGISCFLANYFVQDRYRFSEKKVKQCADALIEFGIIKVVNDGYELVDRSDL